MNELHVVVIVSQVPEFVCKQLRKSVIVRIGPYTKLLTKKLKNVLPPNFWIFVYVRVWIFTFDAFCMSVSMFALTMNVFMCILLFLMHVGGLTFLPIVHPWCGHTYFLKQQGWGGQRSRRSAVTRSLPSCTAHPDVSLAPKTITKMHACAHASLLWSLQMTWPYMHALCISAIMEEIAAATQQTQMLMRFFIDRKVCFIKGQLGQQWKILIHHHVVSKFVWKNRKSQLFISYLFW